MKTEDQQTETEEHYSGFLKHFLWLYLEKHNDDHDEYHAGDVIQEVVGEGGQAAMRVNLHRCLRIGRVG